MTESETPRLVTAETRNIARGDQFSYFSDSICPVYCGIRPEKVANGTDFEAAFSAVIGTNIAFAEIQAPGHSAHRQQREMAHYPDDCFFLNMSAHSYCNTIIGNNKSKFRSGQLYLLDNTKGFTLDFEGQRRIGVHSLRISSDVLRDAGFDRAQDVAVALALSPIGQLVRQQFLLACEALRMNRPLLVYAFAQSVLAALNEMKVPVPEKVDFFRSPSLNEMKEMAGQHLSNPGYSIMGLAVECKCTLRTVQNRFAEAGETFSQWLLRQRLDLSKQLLANPDETRSSIESVSLACGFVSATHFHRAFKAHVGTTPNLWRKTGV